MRKVPLPRRSKIMRGEPRKINSKNHKRASKPIEKHWYHLHCSVCVSCGREDITRERMYGEKPKDWYEWHTLDEYLCECTL